VLAYLHSVSIAQQLVADDAEMEEDHEEDEEDAGGEEGEKLQADGEQKIPEESASAETKQSERACSLKHLRELSLMRALLVFPAAPAPFTLDPDLLLAYQMVSFV
jgi:hypothetical protein